MRTSCAPFHLLGMIEKLGEKKLAMSKGRREKCMRTPIPIMSPLAARSGRSVPGGGYAVVTRWLRGGYAVVTRWLRLCYELHNNPSHSWVLGCHAPKPAPPPSETYVLRAADRICLTD